MNNIGDFVVFLPGIWFWMGSAGPIVWGIGGSECTTLLTSGTELYLSTFNAVRTCNSNITARNLIISVSFGPLGDFCNFLYAWNGPNLESLANLTDTWCALNEAHVTSSKSYYSVNSHVLVPCGKAQTGHLPWAHSPCEWTSTACWTWARTHHYRRSTSFKLSYFCTHSTAFLNGSARVTHWFQHHHLALQIRIVFTQCTQVLITRQI